MKYVPVRLSTLRAETTNPFDLYLKLHDRFVLYIRSGDGIDKARLDNLVEKEVNKLFINGEDEKNYQEYVDKTFLQAISKDSNLDIKEKVSVINSYAMGAVEELFEDPGNYKAYLMIEKASDGMIKILSEESDSLRPFYDAVSETKCEKSFMHSVRTACLASCLAEKMNLSDFEVHDIVVASFLLDIGKTKMAEEFHHLFFKKEDEFTKEEWKAYREHPELSCQILTHKDHASATVLELIRNHEERRSGTGFPKGSKNLTQAMEIVGLAATYDRKITCLGMSIADARMSLQIDEVGKFDLNLIKVFNQMLKERNM